MTCQLKRVSERQGLDMAVNMILLRITRTSQALIIIILKEILIRALQKVQAWG